MTLTLTEQISQIYHLTVENQIEWLKKQGLYDEFLTRINNDDLEILCHTLGYTLIYKGEMRNLSPNVGALLCRLIKESIKKHTINGQNKPIDGLTDALNDITK